jgi:hypothetical protein
MAACRHDEESFLFLLTFEILRGVYPATGGAQNDNLVDDFSDSPTSMK